MKRRGFFGSLFSLPVIGLAAKPAGAVDAETPGVDWQPKCVICKKTAPVAIFVPLDHPVGVPVQCPFCLSVYDTTNLGQLIRDYNLQYGRNVK